MRHRNNTGNSTGAEPVVEPEPVPEPVVDPETPELSSNANLSSISIENATLNPEFSSDVTSYTVQVEHSVTAITLTAQAEDSLALLTYSNEFPLTLAVGENTIGITVKAEDNTEKVYTLTVSRAGSSDKAITDFSFAALSESAARGDGSISFSVPYGTAVNALVATFTTTGSSVTVAGVPQVSGVTANDFSSPVTYIVTAADGTTKNYTVSISYFLETPTGLSPADLSVTVVNTPDLSWTALPGADHYEVQVLASDSSLETIDMSTAYSETVTGTTLATTSAPNGFFWYWRVRAVDAGGATSDWSSINTLALHWAAASVAPQLSLPLSASTTTDTTPELTWETVPGAESYVMQMATSEGGVSTADLIEISGTSWIPDGPKINNTTYYWRIHAKATDTVSGESITTAWSSISYFTLSWGTEGPADGICFVEELELLRGTSYLSGNYTLNADLDLSGYGNWTPIGSSSNKFTGSFNGNGHIITGLEITGVSTDYQGLFGYIDTAGSVSNLSLEAVNITGNNCSYLGALAGNSKGSITDCNAAGIVKSSNSYVGGLIGNNSNASGGISNCWTDCEVNGGDCTGGLIGSFYNSSEANPLSISDCYSLGDVSCESSAERIGGLIGSLRGYVTLSDCHSQGNVNGASTATNTGGLLGQAQSHSTTLSCFITNCYAWGNVTGGTNTGGLIGSLGYSYSSSYAPASVKNSYTSGSVNGGTYSGGLIGLLAYMSSAENCFALGNVNGGSYTGGFAGNCYQNIISNCYSIGSVTGTTTGGFIETANSSTITACFYDRDTSGLSNMGKGTPTYTTDMKTKGTYINAGWDFAGETTNGEEDIWAIDIYGSINQGYPYLANLPLN